MLCVDHKLRSWMKMGRKEAGHSDWCLKDVLRGMP